MYFSRIHGLLKVRLVVFSVCDFTCGMPSVTYINKLCHAEELLADFPDVLRTKPF